MQVQQQMAMMAMQATRKCIRCTMQLFQAGTQPQFSSTPTTMSWTRLPERWLRGGARNFHVARWAVLDRPSDVHNCNHCRANGVHTWRKKILMVMVMMMMMVNCFYYDKKGDSFDFKTRLATLCQGFALTHSHTLRNCVKFNPIALQKTSRRTTATVRLHSLQRSNR